MTQFPPSHRGLLFILVLFCVVILSSSLSNNVNSNILPIMNPTNDNIINIDHREMKKSPKEGAVGDPDDDSDDGGDDTTGDDQTDCDTNDEDDNQNDDDDENHSNGDRAATTTFGSLKVRAGASEG